uniref:Competence protein ComEA n=1 Tax=uncultured Thiotrichaceae bacterium TaxID=298394 RepID=A0A6S6U4A3_9GAMM|nr:MAG: Unknown protein [uncultured Thiotrichaceae bacterium]
MRKFFTSVVLAAGLLSSPFLLADMVNLNKATAAALQENLKGVGEKKAQAIVAYRTEHGAFKTLDEIKEVKGIGDGIFKKIKVDLSLTEGVTGVIGKAGAKGESGDEAKSEGVKPVEDAEG